MNDKEREVHLEIAYEQLDKVYNDFKHWGDKEQHDNHSIDFFEFVSELEVVGNIHDNMELLDRGEVE